QVDDDDDHSEGNDKAHDQGHVTLGGRQDGDLAQARDAEDLLDDHGAAEEADERQGQDGQAGPPAFRSTCLNSTLRSEMPRLRRVRTQSWRSESMTELRTCWAIPATRAID